MWRYRSAVLMAAFSVSLAGASARAQRPGGVTSGQPGMMGMRHDSASMALMGVIHELVVNHDRIKRTVTNLPNGIRTVTESDDPRLAQLIRKHVATMGNRVRKGDDPGLPIESPAVHKVFRDKDQIHTTTETTAKGIVVVQTSSDSTTVAALQQHAAEVSDLVQGGMAAMHAAMMKNGGMMQGTTMPSTMMPSTMMPGRMAHGSDSAFAALQKRGMQAMGVDQYTSTHRFDALPDGGRIELQRDVDDTAGVAQIRRHLQEIAKAFASGDFSTPAFVHMQDVPGTKVMAAKRGVISYTYRELPRGGEVRIVTTDPQALEAVREFMAFQRHDHRAGGMDHDTRQHQGMHAPGMRPTGVKMR
jgi:hypothetical protein